jgi:hypothetical protein
MNLSYCACEIINLFLYGKTKEKVYTTDSPEFGSNLSGENLIIDKSVNGLKSCAVIFHELLTDSVL